MSELAAPPQGSHPPVFTSTIQFAAALAAPALARAFHDLADHARAGADILEEFAGRMSRAGYAAGVPVPAWAPPATPAQRGTLEDLARLAVAEGRVVYAP